MPTLIFRLKKRADANAQLILVREDGSHTVGQIGPAAGYGPIHDITHYAIEQTLGVSDGFLGLVACGWEISDFEVKGTAGRLPPDAIFAEVAAGELSRQVVMRQTTTLENYLWAIDLTLVPQGVARPEITLAQFESITGLLFREWDRWRALAPNETMELTFTCPRRATTPAPTQDERRSRALTHR